VAITTCSAFTDPAALEALEDVAQNDPDPELRDKAAQAAQWIRAIQREKLTSRCLNLRTCHLLRETGIRYCGPLQGDSYGV